MVEVHSLQYIKDLVLMVEVHSLQYIKDLVLMVELHSLWLGQCLCLVCLQGLQVVLHLRQLEGMQLLHLRLRMDLEMLGTCGGNRHLLLPLKEQTLKGALSLQRTLSQPWGG